MKLHEMMQFKSKIEKKKHHFDLPNLPDREWEYMLQRAKAESVKQPKINPVYAFMSSMRLSFALSTAIILALVFSLLLNAEQQVHKNTNPKINTASTTRDIDVVNVANSSFI